MVCRPELQSVLLALEKLVVCCPRGPVNRHLPRFSAGNTKIEPTILSPTGIDLSALDIDAVRATQRLISRGFEAYLVGGCVRDLLLGRSPKDYDIATEARPQQVKRVFPRNCRIIGRRFKLAHLHFHGNTKILECSTFRRTPQESGGDDVLIVRDNEFGNAEEDALRRDFTVNALFLDPTRDTILDYAFGLRDVQDRVIRTIGDPVVRFREDPVRILRAAKFAGRLGFSVEPETLAAMAATSGDLVRSAPPRLFEEILRLLRGGHSLDSFQLLRDVGATKSLIPVLAEFLATAPHEERVDFWRLLQALDHRIQDGHTPNSGVLLGALLVCPVLAKVARNPGRSASSIADDMLSPLCADLRLPRRDAGCVKRICGVQHRFLQHDDEKRFRTESFVHGPYFLEAFELFELRTQALGTDPAVVEQWRRFAEQLDPRGGDYGDLGRDEAREEHREEPPIEVADAGPHGGEEAEQPTVDDTIGEPSFADQSPAPRARQSFGGDADEEPPINEDAAAPSTVAGDDSPALPAGDEGPRRRRRRRRGRRRGTGQLDAASQPDTEAAHADAEFVDAPASLRATASRDTFEPHAGDAAEPATGSLDEERIVSTTPDDDESDVDVDAVAARRPVGDEPVGGDEDAPRNPFPEHTENRAATEGGEPGRGRRRRNRRRRGGRGGAEDGFARQDTPRLDDGHDGSPSEPLESVTAPSGDDPAGPTDALATELPDTLPHGDDASTEHPGDANGAAGGAAGGAPGGEAQREGGRRRRRRRGRRTRDGEPGSAEQGQQQAQHPQQQQQPQRQPQGQRQQPRQPSSPSQQRPHGPSHRHPQNDQSPRDQQQRGQRPRQQQQQQQRGHQQPGQHGQHQDDRRRDRRHGAPRDVDVVPRYRDRRGKVDVIEPAALDLSAFDVELDPKRVPTFGSIVEGKGKPKRKSPRVPEDGVDDYRPPPPPGSDAPPAPTPPPSSDSPDTFGDW